MPACFAGPAINAAGYGPVGRSARRVERGQQARVERAPGSGEPGKAGIKDRFGGQQVAGNDDVPRTREALERLPGVGRKTANVVLNTAFGEPTIAVDTHIFRVSNRTGIAPGKTPLEVEKRLLRLTTEEFRKDAHHWLILHGRYICKARKPLCGDCPIVEWCEYRRKELE